VHHQPAVLVADMLFALIKRECLVCHGAWLAKG
jgi:hypothetical protein